MYKSSNAQKIDQLSKDHISWVHLSKVQLAKVQMFFEKCRIQLEELESLIYKVSINLHDAFIDEEMLELLYRVEHPYKA